MLSFYPSFYSPHIKPYAYAVKILPELDEAEAIEPAVSVLGAL